MDELNKLSRQEVLGASHRKCSQSRYEEADKWTMLFSFLDDSIHHAFCI